MPVSGGAAAADQSARATDNLSPAPIGDCNLAVKLVARLGKRD